MGTSWTKFIYFLLFAISICSTNSHAQNTEPTSKPENFQIYKVWANAEEDLKTACMAAQMTDKQILVLIGGNWCVWCKRLHYFMESSSAIQNELKGYVVIHINYSKENKNEAVLRKLNNPQQHGFPVCVLLDKNGKYLLTQPTSDWEKGKSYSEAKITAFLSQLNN